MATFGGRTVTPKRITVTKKKSPSGTTITTDYGGGYVTVDRTSSSGGSTIVTPVSSTAKVDQEAIAQSQEVQKTKEVGIDKKASPTDSGTSLDVTPSGTIVGGRIDYYKGRGGKTSYYNKYITYEVTGTPEPTRKREPNVAGLPPKRKSGVQYVTTFEEAQKQAYLEETPVRAKIFTFLEEKQQAFEKATEKPAYIFPYTTIIGGATRAPINILKSVAHPIKTVKGIAYAVTHPQQVGAAIGQEISARPTSFMGEVAGYALISYGISKGVQYLRTPQVKGKISATKVTEVKRGGEFTEIGIKGRVRVTAKAPIGRTKTYNVPFEAKGLSHGITKTKIAEALKGKMVLQGKATQFQTSSYTIIGENPSKFAKVGITEVGKTRFSFGGTGFALTPKKTSLDVLVYKGSKPFTVEKLITYKKGTIASPEGTWVQTNYQQVGAAIGAKQFTSKPLIYYQIPKQGVPTFGAGIMETPSPVSPLPGTVFETSPKVGIVSGAVELVSGSITKPSYLTIPLPYPYKTAPQRIFTRQYSTPRTTTRSISPVKTIESPFTSPTNITSPISSPVYLPKTISAPRSATIPIQSPITSAVSGGGGGRAPPPVVPFVPITPKFPLTFEPRELKKKEKTIFNIFKQPTKYQPSLVGSAFKIKGKKPKLLTGLEIRPITL